MKNFAKAPRLVAVASALIFAASARASQAPPDPIVSTSDVSLMLHVAGPQPRLAVMNGPAHLSFANRAEEPLPAAVEINGASVPVTWKHNQTLDTHDDPHHAVIIYESSEPHLRLRWEWQARAGFGPIEHRITIENLGDKEVWLPMVDSLQLDWKVAPNDEFRNFYIEKGAGTPSPV